MHLSQGEVCTLEGLVDGVRETCKEIGTGGFELTRVGGEHEFNELADIVREH